MFNSVSMNRKNVLLLYLDSIVQSCGPICNITFDNHKFDAKVSLHYFLLSFTIVFFIWKLKMIHRRILGEMLLQIAMFHLKSKYKNRI